VEIADLGPIYQRSYEVYFQVRRAQLLLEYKSRLTFLILLILLSGLFFEILLLAWPEAFTLSSYPERTGVCCQFTLFTLAPSSFGSRSRPAQL